MTDVDERLLTAAKIREQSKGRLDGNEWLHRHAGIPMDDAHLSALSFVESVFAGAADRPAATFRDTGLGRLCAESFETEAATEAVRDGNGSVLSALAGITETELSGRSLRLPLLLDEALENKGATAFVTVAGAPNSGKTNTVSLLHELRDYAVDDLLVLSNIRTWERTDIVVTSMHDLAVTCLEYRDVPKAVVVDEASTHFDARTYRTEVAEQWSPMAKRFSKVGVDMATLIGHTGKDIHPEAKRLTSLGIMKEDTETAAFFDTWPAESDRPDGQLFDGSVLGLEPTTLEYDPDDAAPWSWNLKAELFAADTDWDGLLSLLRESGPVRL
jgi:hypothetical protein